MTFLCYSSLRHSLPEEVKNSQSRLTPIHFVFPYKLRLVSESSVLSKLAYKVFITALRPLYEDARQNLVKKWVRDIGVSCEGSMVDVSLVTRNTILLSLHFRLISRIVTTNMFLYMIGKSETSSCTFCKTESETLLHLFWKCPVVQNFIKEFTDHLMDNYEITLQYDEKNWFFPKYKQDTVQGNSIAMIAKLIIYRARNNGVKPSLPYFLNTLKIEIEKERCMARRNNKETDFLIKWGRLDHIEEE